MGVEAVLTIFVILLVLYIILNSVRVLPEYERLVVLRLGKYAGTRGPGLTVLIPFIEQARRVDMRERFLEIPRQTAISKDNTSIDIDFLVYYRIVNPKLSVLEVENVIQASLNIAATTLRAVIGDIELDDVLARREQINDILRVKLDEVTERWGVKITRVEIREIEPPAAVKESMNRQMSAERERRATVTRAEGERAAAIMVAEGEKQSAILRAEGEKSSSVLRAEGERQAQLLLAQGRAAALEALFAEAKDIDDKTMLLQYLDTLKAVGESDSTKFVLPLEMTTMMSRLLSVIETSARSGSSNGTSSG
ncbi:SPFH/Band 7/PHB domain protein [Anaerolineae bacterium CFX9]|nr:SPFH domain-containing protein [Kamptonema cortianum]MDL1902717.1 SPFH/Band 7/PHB domain protein [Anaerolineae bacterium CFX9]